MSQDIIQRIQDRLDALSKTARAASIEAGMSPDCIRGIIRKPDSSPTVHTLSMLSTSLETTPEWLAFGVESDLIGARTETAQRIGRLLRVSGEVAAGRWLAIDDHVDESAFEPVPVTPDPRWPEDAQYGLVVRGTSINRQAIDGDILHCVDIAATGVMPRSGELVIVEQIQYGGQLRERTAKIYHLGENEALELRPDSDDERWQEPIRVPHRSLDWRPREDLQVVVRAFVIGFYRATRGRGARR